MALYGDEHAILGAERQTRGFPGPKIVASGDGAAAVHLGEDGPVLLEGRSANDRGVIGALLRPDLVRAAVALYHAVQRRAGVVVGIMIAHGFDHVVSYERIGRPAIESEVSTGAFVELECTRVVYLPKLMESVIDA